MKLSQSVALLSVAVPSVAAFSPALPRTQFGQKVSTSRFMAASQEQDIVGESAMPEADPYERIGISKDELALGIDATEFLQWIGSKQELVEKFQRDNKGFDEERALQEVSKFMLDSEMVNAYIKFERDKVENPPDLKAEAEQNLSDPKTIATYAAWLIGGASFGYVRKNIIEPKFESGEWEEIHIALPGFKPEAAAEAAQSVSSAASSIDYAEVVDNLHAGVDGVLSTLV
eukprot:CAMPEP_0176001916 /NCGR_PEP_ID=MMETSP0120_2-20121206/376_1 /TAXON_ID=160619 /ORGANISM="Kryptoperidinium foliaceum, Strain CCMP 1326" /LENGTH=229 /DNA_ID=CAMNT_0017334485 /DNA_START=64 /DNA_END=753 /DNA_ORIENTATION=-